MHHFHFLGQDSSTVAHRAEMTVDERCPKQGQITVSALLNRATENRIKSSVTERSTMKHEEALDILHGIFFFLHASLLVELEVCSVSRKKKKEGFL